MTFLIRRPGSSWAQPSTTTYDNEAELQAILEQSPELLPLDAPIVLVREFWVPDVGSVDLVGISSTGDIVVIECKLRANPQIRREVVGQALAYAGGIWRMGLDDFVQSFEKLTGESLETSLGTLGVEDTTAARIKLGESLTSGDFRIVIAVDEITSELRTIVEFLNIHTSGMDIVLLELNYSRENDIEILVPSAYGAEAAGSKRPGPGPNQNYWGVSELRTAAAANLALADVVDLINELLNHAEEHAAKFGAGSGKTPGLGVHYTFGGEPTPFFQLYLGPDGDAKAQVSPSFGAVRLRSEKAALAFLDHLTGQPGFDQIKGFGADDLNRYPNLDISVLGHAGVAALLEIIDELRD